MHRRFALQNGRLLYKSLPVGTKKNSMNEEILRNMSIYCSRSQIGITSFIHVCSRTPRGVRGLKSAYLRAFLLWYRRTPRGVRGLKFFHLVPIYILHSRTPRGVRGLKFTGFSCIGSFCSRRTPRGVRGLKFIE